MVQQLSQLSLKHLDPEILAKIAWVFDGTPKSIERASGGLILAEPTELSFSSSPPASLTEIKVRMVFLELERNRNREIISQTIITASKLVAITEIQEGFKINPGLQGFVVDLGLGIIPVRLISSRFDHHGFEWALVSRQDDFEKARFSSKPQQIALFEVPKKLLRWITPVSLEGKKDFQWAKTHLQALVRLNKKIVPSILELPRTVTLEPSLSLNEIDKSLKEQTSSLRLPHTFLIPLDENSEP